MSELSGFITSVVINFLIGIIAFLAFCFARTRNPMIYEPRVRYGKRHRPEPLPTGFFSWMGAVRRVTDEEFYKSAGPDALVYTMFFSYGFEVFMFCSFFGLAILLPINVTSFNQIPCDSNETLPTNETALCDVEGLETISLSNIPERSSRLWAHLVCMYLFTFFSLYKLKEYYLKYIKYRNMYVQEGAPHHHSVLVRDIDSETATSEALLAKFVDMYPDTHSAHVYHNTETLRALVAERTKVMHALEHTAAVNDINASKGKDKRLQYRDGGFLCFGGTKVDKQEYLQSQLDELNMAVAAEQMNCENHPNWGEAGFVTFGSIKSAMVAAQINHTAAPVNMTTGLAPEPKDVIWENLRINASSRSIRRLLAYAATFWLVVFWAIPVAFVSALTTLDSLCEQSDFVCSIIESNDQLRDFLQGFLPGLALLIFMAILPMILTMISRAEGIPAISWVDHSMLKKYYIFQVVNVFFVSLISGSFFDQINLFLEGLSLSDITDLLGTAIPATGIFFTTYVMLISISKFPVDMLRIGPLIISWLKLKFLAKTVREKWNALRPEPFRYGQIVPVQLLVILLGLTYAVTNPLILPFVLIFFAMGYYTNRYQHMWVYVPETEQGGLLWPTIHTRIIVGVFVHVLAMIGIFGVKKAPIQSAFCFPLLFGVLMYYRHFNREYERLARFLPRDNVPDDTEECHGEEYLQPALRAPERVEPCPWDADPEKVRDQLALTVLRNPHETQEKYQDVITAV